KKLVTILTDAPVETRFEEIEIGPRDDEALKSLFVEFEFNALGKRLFGEDFQAGRGHRTVETNGGALVAELRTIDDFEKRYRFLRADDAAGRAALIGELKGRTSWCFDLETTSLDEKTTSVIGLAFSWNEHE